MQGLEWRSFHRVHAMRRCRMSASRRRRGGTSSSVPCPSGRWFPAAARRNLGRAGRDAVGDLDLSGHPVGLHPACRVHGVAPEVVEKLRRPITPATTGPVSIPIRTASQPRPVRSRSPRSRPSGARRWGLARRSTAGAPTAPALPPAHDAPAPAVPRNTEHHIRAQGQPHNVQHKERDHQAHRERRRVLEEARDEQPEHHQLDEKRHKPHHRAPRAV